MEQKDIFEGLPTPPEGHYWSNILRRVQPGHIMEEKALYWPIERARIAHECNQKGVKVPPGTMEFNVVHTRIKVIECIEHNERIFALCKKDIISDEREKK